MKKITLFLLSCVLLATACNQSSTNPTVPPANTFSIDSTYYFKINFNGQTLCHYSVFADWGSSGSGYVSYPFAYLNQSSINASSYQVANAYIQSSDVDFQFILNRIGDTLNSPIGAYDFHGLGAGSILGITDLNTSKVYGIDSASTILNVTNIAVSSVTGVMSGKLKDGGTLIPFTSSFCLKKLL